MTRLAADQVTVRRGGRTILDNVTLELASGDFIALLGPNGAGKSTLLSALAGLLTPDQGGVQLDGAPLAAINRRALAQRRAFLPQSPRAEWPISVERLVALGLTPQLPTFGGLQDDMAANVTDILVQVDLVAQRDQPATTLSGGELARAMLARAMIGNPDILIADEPLAGLDPRHALDCIKRLRSLADNGKLVIASIHDLTLAARYAGHVAVLHEGRLVAYGETATTLTSDLMRATFDVESDVRGAGTSGAIVNFTAS